MNKSTSPGRGVAQRQQGLPPMEEQPGATLRRAALLADLARNVRGLRARHGLSQQALAARAGLSPRFVAQLEAGEGNISVAKLAELARALEAPLMGLLATAGDGATGNGDDAADLRGQIAAELEGHPVPELRALLASLRAGRGPSLRAGAPLIALVGLRGAGKSTVGPLLAEALGRHFVELDEEIQELTGLANSEIFELHGEGYYREAERHALERLIARGRPVVLAVSGGAVTDPALFGLLKERALLVWVRADPEQHMQRVVSQGDRRPMADRPDAMEELRGLLRARAPYYEQAQLVADTSTASPAACVGQLVAQLERLGG